MTPDGLGALTRDAVLGYYETIADPANAILITSGDISVEEGTALTEQYFGD